MHPTHTLEQLITLIQSIEPVLDANGYHAGITGSVLFYGHSTDDFDVLLYPHDPAVRLEGRDILAKIEHLDFVVKKKCNEKYHNREVWKCLWKGQYNVDFFIIKS